MTSRFRTRSALTALACLVAGAAIVWSRSFAAPSPTASAEDVRWIGDAPVEAVARWSGDLMAHPAEGGRVGLTGSPCGRPGEFAAGGKSTDEDRPYSDVNSTASGEGHDAHSAETAPTVGVDVANSATNRVEEHAQANRATLPAGVERRMYDLQPHGAFGFADRRPVTSSDVAAARSCVPPVDLYVDPFVDRGLAFARGDAAARLGLVRLPPTTWNGPIEAFQGRGEDLDAWERALDAHVFAGGRTLALKVVRLASAVRVLAEAGVEMPKSGTWSAINLSTALALATRERGSSSSVALDASEDRRVFAFVGMTDGCFIDFDVEVAQDSFIADPLTEQVESGLGIAARLEGTEGGGLCVRIEARFAAALPSFDCDRTWGTTTDTATQVVVAGKFAGLVPVDDAHGVLVTLSDGEVLLVLPAGPVVESTRVPAWLRHRETDGKTAEVVPALEAYEVRWRRTDCTGTDSDGAARFDEVKEFGVVGTPSPSDAPYFYGRGLTPPGSAYLVPGPVLDVRRIDVVVSPTRSLDPATRRVPAAPLFNVASFELPRVQRSVIPLRFWLAVGDTAEREVELDTGDGVETWCVTLTRSRTRP